MFQELILRVNNQSLENRSTGKNNQLTNNLIQSFISASLGINDENIKKKIKRMTPNKNNIISLFNSNQDLYELMTTNLQSIANSITFKIPNI